MKPATCLIVLLLSALFAPLAAAAECADMPADPAISVRIDAAPVRHDHALSVAALSKIPSESRRAGMEAYDRTLGLTEANINTNADMKLFTMPDGQGGFCTTARSATIVVKWTTTVHIASEIQPGSCIDRVVGAHEEKHVAIDAALMPIGRRAIELALTAVIRHGVAGSTAGQSRQNLQDQARDAVNQAIDAFALVRTRRQLALDSPDEYDKVQRTCGILEYIHVMHQAGDSP